MTFSLNVKLKQDCHFITETETCLILLLDNALYHWFVLVPKVDEKELHELEEAMQVKVFNEVMQLSKLVKNTLGADKINLATIGNIVSQLHIHVIGRHYNDATWPGVVWGADPREAYAESRVAEIRQLVIEQLK